MKCFFPLLLFACLVMGRDAIAAVTPATIFWHDTTVVHSVQPPDQATEKKVGFFGKVKNVMVSFFIKKTALKKTSDASSTMGIIALSLIIIGLGVPILGGPTLFLLLIPAALLTGIISLFIKNDTGSNRKNTRSKTAAIAAIIISGGLLAFLLILSLAWGGHR